MATMVHSGVGKCVSLTDWSAIIQVVPFVLTKSSF
jgi:hypothetical protein